MLFFCALVTAQYSTLNQIPDFENSISITDIEPSDLETHYSYLPAGESWIGKKFENWNQFFGPGESVNVKFYYQKNESSKLIDETIIPILKVEPWFYKVQYIGFHYVVLEGINCKVILKYWRSETGICQYMKTICSAVNLIVDFEPDLNLIQTDPYHFGKEDSWDAFVSAKLEKNTTEWKLKFWSSEVDILSFVELDNYSSSFDSEFSLDTLIVTFYNVAEIENELLTQEQLISVLNVDL